MVAQRWWIEIGEIYEYDINNTLEELDEYCAKADFVFNLAGVNRPENPEDFMKGNFGFASQLLDTLKKHNNKAGIMLSSSATTQSPVPQPESFYLLPVDLLQSCKHAALSHDSYCRWTYRFLKLRNPYNS